MIEKMKIILIVVFSLGVIGCSSLNNNDETDNNAEPNPENQLVYENIPYNNDGHQKHLLDIYMPTNNATENIPLVVFIHGGGWLSNDKYADLGYMKNTVEELKDSGYAIASIDYRWSTQAVFPAQIQDVNQAIEYLYIHANEYGFDTSRFAVMGFSAGGHLASLAGLSNNNEMLNFLAPNANNDFSIKAVVDFYGPMDLTLFPGANDPNSPEALLLGTTPADHPDLAAVASPLTYIDENDPPFLIIHGEKDTTVNPEQSSLLKEKLDAVNIPNELIIVENAPHFGTLFDQPSVRTKVLAFLNENL